MSAGDTPVAPPATKRPLRRWPWIVAGVVATLVVVASAGFVVWATSTADPQPVAIAALDSDELVQVIEDDGFVFEPTAGARLGFIFYPGGRVDPASYAAFARQIAEAGYLVVVPQLRLNLAVFDANAATDIITAHPLIEQWAIGGHSLGGSMAAQFAADNPGAVSGLSLWAAYPPDGTDLASAELVVVSVFGTRDGLTSLDDIDDSRSRLPPSTEFVAIDGGNHAQFGDYGAQPGDNPATISADAQRQQTVAATVQMLAQIDQGGR